MSMFYKKISQIIDNSDFIRSFDAAVLSQTSGWQMYHLNRSAKSLLLARAFAVSGRNVVFVTADDKVAEDYLEDLDLLLGAESAYFLPDYEVLPYEQRSPHYLIRAQRIETLTAAVSIKPAVFTVSIRSLLRKIAAAEIFGKNIITLKKGEDFNPDLLVSNLVGLGYENQFQVSKVGELARRGGIIDVFSPNSHKPVRLEFFGDEVESIRVFSVSSQRSTGEELDTITLIPSREFSLHDIDTTEEMWQRIHKDGFYDGIELDASLLLPKVETFLQYFTVNNCIIFWDEYQYFSSAYQEIISETINLYEKTHLKYKKRLLPKPEDIFESEKYLKLVFRDYSNFFLNTSWLDIIYAPKSLEAPVTAQTVMHGSLEILEQEVAAKLEKNYHVILQSDNQSQSKRMLELLPQFENRIDFTIGVLQNGFNLHDARLAIFTDHEIFSRYKRKRRQAHFSKDEALVDYESLKQGDYVVHIDHGIGIYAGLNKLQVGGNIIECLTLRYAENDVVYVPTFQLSLVSKFVSEEGIVPTIHKLGSKKWENTKTRAKRQIELVAEDLIKLYAERRLRRGIAFDADCPWQTEMEDSFIYEDTPDQTIATKEIKADMETDSPMERLLCGDVGFGKTEVAIRAAFKAVMSGWQTAVLVPTTLLAEQHFLVFRERLAQYPLRIAMFSRFRSTAGIRKDIARLERGEIDIAIGTHRLLSKDVKYKKLGLLIIDEEHRFGVRHKDKLRQLKSNVDTLYMSATPIPRTMYMALSKLKELSLIRTSPKARLPIRTVIVPWDKDIIKDAISREVDRGGQVFFVHNRVQTIDSIAAEMRKHLPNVSFEIGHGQLPEKQLEAVTLDFAHHKFDVLIASSIIESGIDIPNANTIIVNRADMFGLAQLYQIRGRVGRSNRRAYAYLIIPPKMPEEARKRLETLIEYESLGSGYQIAMRDMELRGAGTLLGTKQSGVINSIGYNYYNRLLEKAVENIQTEKNKEKWLEEEPQNFERLRIECDHYFPESYIGSEKERLEIYRRMIGFEETGMFDLLQKELVDRFGKIPPEAMNAFRYYRLRLLIQKTGLHSLKTINGNIIFEFSAKNMPARQKLASLFERFPFQFKIDATKNFKVIFQPDSEIAKSNDTLLNTALEMICYWQEIQ